MAQRLIEEIILKVGVDATSLNDSLAKVSNRLDSFKNKVGKLGDTTGKLEDDLDDAGDQAKKTGDKFDKLEDEINPLDKGFDKLTKALKKYNKESKKTANESTRLSKGLNGIATAIGTAAVVATITSRITALNEAAQDSQRLGIVAQNLINLQNIGRTFGATAEDVTQGIKNINESASEAFKEGKGGKFDLFKELNIDLESFNKLKADEQFESFSRSISGVTDQGRRTAIQLALMGEEGFKLAVTMDELGSNAEAAKLKVQGFTGSLNTKELEKLNKSLVESKLRFEGVINTIVQHGAEGFNTLGSSIDNVAFSLFGVLKLHEDFIDRQNAQIELVRKLNIERDEAAKKEKLAKKKEISDQKELNELIRLANEELNDPKRLESIENSPEIQAKVAKEQKRIFDLRVDQRREDIKAEEKKTKEEERSKKKSLKAIADIGLARKKEFIKRLQEESKRGGAGIIEAGSVEEAEIAASLQNRDAGKLSQIETLQKQVDAEEKMREEEKLKVAKETLEAIKKQKSPIKVNTRSL